MDFKLPPELDALKLTIRQIVKRECIPLERTFLTRSPDEGREHEFGESGGIGTLTDEEYEHLKKISQDTGIYSMHLPEKYGGGGLGAVGAVVVDEEVRRSIVHLPFSQCPNILLEYATPEQAKKYALPCAEGKMVPCFAQTEPQAGSDPGGMIQTKAVRDGKDWVINGTKMFITSSHIADFMLLQAVTDEAKRQRGGITMFIVDTKAPGVTMSPIKTWITPARSAQNFVYLDNVRVPNGNVLGGLGDGFKLAQQWLAHHDRLMRGSMALGIMVRALEMAVDWSKQRITLGKPISERQAIQWMLVDIYISIMALRGITWWNAWRSDQGEDIRVEASMVKYCAGEWGWQSIDKVLQIFGGLGETMAMPIPHWYHQLRHARVGGGTSEIHKFIMARALLSGTVSWEA